MAESKAKLPRLCPLIAFDQVVGGKYKLRTLSVLIKTPCRYGEIRKSLVIACQGKPVTPRILSRELKELEKRGLIDRKQYPVVPPKVEDSLTKLGTRLIPIIEAIIEWGLTGAHEVLPKVR
jgi:DNA-binding HxlR family transcriptional regulator